MSKVGDRVGALLSIDKNEGVVKLIGYGTYVGDEVPPQEVGGMNMGLPNPKIELDDGGFVFGCECWWGSEKAIKNHVKKFNKVILVDIEEERRK